MRSEQVGGRKCCASEEEDQAKVMAREQMSGSEAQTARVSAGFSRIDEEGATTSGIAGVQAIVLPSLVLLKKGVQI